MQSTSVDYERYSAGICGRLIISVDLKSRLRERLEGDEDSPVVLTL